MQSLPQQNILRILQWRRRKCTEHGMTPSNAHSGARKSLTKQNCFKMHHLANKSTATLHTLLKNKPASMEWGIHSSPTWMIGWPELTPALQQGTRNSKKQYCRGWLQITNCPSRTPASMAQRSHKECLHHYYEEIRSSFFPCSSWSPAEKAFKLQGTD